MSPVAYTPRYRTKTDTYAFFTEDKLALNEQLVGGGQPALGPCQGGAHRPAERSQQPRQDLRVRHRPPRRGVCARCVAVVLCAGGARGRPADLAHLHLGHAGAVRAQHRPAGRGRLQAPAGRQPRGLDRGGLSHREDQAALARRDRSDHHRSRSASSRPKASRPRSTWRSPRLLRLEANVAKLRARYDDFNEVVSERLVSRAGNTPAGVPEEAANLWLNWRFLPRWEADFGVRYAGPRQVDSANSRKIGSYTVADAGVSWQANPSLKRTARLQPGRSPLRGVVLERRQPVAAGPPAFVRAVGSGHLLSGAPHDVRMAPRLAARSGTGSTGRTGDWALAAACCSSCGSSRAS